MRESNLSGADADGQVYSSNSGQDLSIDVDDLRLTYDDGTEAVAGISMTVPKGEFFGFLGPNGAGKTTTIKMLATLLRPTSGSVKINGYDAETQQRAVRGTVGYMAQEISVDEELTARENLQFACDAYGVARSGRENRVDQLLDLVDLADVADTPAEQFSGGMKKRLDAATALVHDPDLVFLDEPTTGLDPKARNRLWEYFETINEQGTTIFLTTQYLEEADVLCDRLAVIKDGTIVADDSPESLKRRVGGDILSIGIEGGRAATERAAEVASSGELFESTATIDTTPDEIRVSTQFAKERGTDLVADIQQAGLSITSFDIEEATLDDVFLAIADDEVDNLDSETKQMEGPR